MAGPVVTVTMQGTESAIAKLRTLPDKIQKRAMVKATRAGVAPLKKAAYRNMPRATGIARQSLDTKIKSYQAGKVQVGIVGQKRDRRAERSTNREIRAGRTLTGKLRSGRGGISGRGDLVPIHLIENDTKPHRIPKDGRKGMLLLRLPSGHRMLVESVNHPGTKGTHPIARASDSAGAESAQRFSDKLTTEVEIEAAKVAAGV